MPPSTMQEQEEDDDWETKAETLQAPAGLANGANSKRIRCASVISHQIPVCSCCVWRSCCMHLHVVQTLWAARHRSSARLDSCGIHKKPCKLSLAWHVVYGAAVMQAEERPLAVPSLCIAV